MLVNPDVNGYTTTVNHRKILRKKEKTPYLKPRAEPD